jgi:HNH endonuclease
MDHSAICANCGTTYTRNRPIRGTTCSKTCSAAFHRRRRETRTCKACGASFEVKPASNAQFCSISCFNGSPYHHHGRTSKSPLIVACERCGKQFRRHNGHINQRFCSVTCVRDSRPSPRTFFCKHCGKNVTQKLGQKDKQFCSVSCARKYANDLKRETNRKNGIYPNSREAKRAILETSAGCVRCGWSNITEILEIHHRDLNRGNNHISNLELLCPTCHTMEHYLTGTGQFTNNKGRIARMIFSPFSVSGITTSQERKK